jgi:hypothetical protein
VKGLSELHSDQQGVSSNPAGGNFVLEFMECLDIRVDYRTPYVAQWTMWIVFKGQRKNPNEIIVRQQQSSKIGTCQQVRGFLKANTAQKTLN